MASTADRRALLALLGVDERASWEEARRAFRDAVRASHPDLHAGDPAAERRLKTLNAAWELVNTPGKWTAYLSGSSAAGGPGGPGGPTGPGGRAPRPAAPTVGRLHVMRQRAGSAGLRRWQLELDGEVVASIENGGVSRLEAGPGRHSLRVFYGSCSSRPLGLQVRAGEELVLGCRQESNPLLSLYAPKRSLVLEQLDRRRLS